jgi:hypothetical protein
MVVADLATVINNALGPPLDKNGAPISVTPQMTAYATAVINTLKAGVVAHAAGTVTGSGAPGAALSGGAAAGGTVSGLSSATWLAAIGTAFGSAPGIAADASSSVAYLMGAAKVAFAAGTVTGTCTATPSSPGPLSGGAASGGTISGLSGSAWAAAAGEGSQPFGATVYGAIAGYIMGHAVAAYASGKVTGAFAAGGGAMTAGTGAGGSIT